MRDPAALLVALGRELRFDAEDLAENRQGRLSRRQMWRFLLVATAVFATVMVALAPKLVFRRPVAQMDQLDHVVTFGLPLIAVVLYGWICVRICGRRIRAIEGPAYCSNIGYERNNGRRYLKHVLVVNG